MIRLASVVAVAAIAVAGAGLAAQTPAARRPHVVFVTGDDEYRSEISMPMIAAILEKHHGLRTSVAYAKPGPKDKNHIEGLEALERADLMVMYLRFRALPDAELTRILKYVESGKPMIGFRTTTHAFLYPPGGPNTYLNDGFGQEVFGQKWIVHHGHKSTTSVTVDRDNASHPILNGVADFPAASWLYHVAPLSGRNTTLLTGTSLNSDRTKRPEYPPVQPVAWTREYKGARVFFTTLGHPADFEQASMRRLTVNAILWALGRPVPTGGAEATPVATYVAPPTH
jgi:uncharacterized protein